MRLKCDLCLAHSAANHHSVPAHKESGKNVKEREKNSVGGWVGGCA